MVRPVRSLIPAGLIFLALIAAGGVAAVFLRTPKSTEPTETDARAGLRAHPARQVSFYAGKDFEKAPLERRIFEAPPELLDLLTKDNASFGFAAVPKRAELSQEFMENFELAIEGMPAAVRSWVAEKLVGVFVVSDLGSTAFTDSLVENGAEARKGILVLDATVLSQS
ncbi:MAG TPA: hypothetical protein VFV50_11275, partial [Bdellovibrionales bacterium]|nr:hypothetical protein [Bdellovibrionales bacterium]